MKFYHKVLLFWSVHERIIFYWFVPLEEEKMRFLASIAEILVLFYKALRHIGTLTAYTYVLY